ncbi:MAG TPA: hypothetical protein VH229_11045 [Candidatus Udaeobacter sp.]|jgi:hypothetical protein|nr:hypothetical protein [Candidatus Udaeobacter sp.]
MQDDEKTKPRLEIAHVLFIDIVEYSKLLTDEQSEALQELNQIIRNTEAVREPEAAGRLIILPTGDGMALGLHRFSGGACRVRFGSQPGSSRATEPAGKDGNPQWTGATRQGC